jgi:hypothetical protein
MGMKKAYRWILLILAIGLLAYVGFWIYTVFSFASEFDQSYSQKDLIENYNAKSVEIKELKNYISRIVPSNKIVEIEFDDDNTLSIFHVTINGKQSTNWDLKSSSSITDTLLAKLGWTRAILWGLKEKLDKANCISIKSGEPFTIGYQRSGMGIYFYKIFELPLTESQKKKYNDGCTYIHYKKNIVLEYGSGVLGPDCFDEL